MNQISYLKLIFLYRSQEQQHSFNYPYQLAIVPSDWRTDSKDMPLDSDNYEFTVEHGDIIALASDGVLDNVYDSEMAKEIGSLQLGPDTPNTEKLQVFRAKTNWELVYILKMESGSVEEW